MPIEPDTITVTGTATVEVAATHADVQITVRGSSSFGPDQALTKAREVVALVEALRALSIPQDRIELLGVATQSTSGRVTRSSSAAYRLNVRTDTLDQVPLVIDAVAGQKNAGIDNVAWRYPEDAGRQEALTGAVAQARAKADSVAAALEVRLQGVRRFTEHAYGRDPGPVMQASARMEGAGPALDLDVAHYKELVADVEITYRVG